MKELMRFKTAVRHLNRARIRTERSAGGFIVVSRFGVPLTMEQDTREAGYLDIFGNGFVSELVHRDTVKATLKRWGAK